MSSIGGERVRSFLPPPLPPEPPVHLGPLLTLLEEANRALGRLDGLSGILPDPDLFLYAYVRKEALLSSQIEGTQSSLSDLLAFESQADAAVAFDDVREVSNYVAAMNHGLDRLRGGLPLSLRLIREIHGRLLSDGRGSEKDPGEFRRTQNWIGGTRPGNAVFVPPPQQDVLRLMGELEQFMHASSDLPLLVKIGLVHVQFETIHPFLDGNGRIGRLLITFLLCACEALQRPLLYLSLYFKQNRQTYYELLQAVRERGDWESWTEFFLRGVRDTARSSAAAATEALAMFRTDRASLEAAGVSLSTLRVHELLQRRPFLSAKVATELSKLSPPTVNAAFGHLIESKVAREVTGRKRNRLFVYGRYFDLLSEGVEPLRP